MEGDRCIDTLYGLLYLPLYSSDLNPIEHQWFGLKNRMRKQIPSGESFRQVVDHAFMA
ncbi:transposase [Halomicronema sp. CCY15110]|uniref:transposase n=1 Tax=Halomicronema sp. CCY15110 TaxID=2767773 RepID=UPI0035CCD488